MATTFTARARRMLRAVLAELVSPDPHRTDPNTVDPDVIEAYARGLRQERDDHLDRWRRFLDQQAAREKFIDRTGDDVAARPSVIGEASVRLHTAFGLREALHQLHVATDGRFGDHEDTQARLFDPTHRPEPDEDTTR